MERGAAARGFTVIEALVALLIGWLIAGLALGTFARQRTLQANLARRGEVLSALRTARYVLGREVRAGDGSEAVGGDTLGLRAFRGVALICPEDAGPAHDVRVRVEGVRAADPGKDSVWVLGPDGTARVFGLIDREVGVAPCPGASEEEVERWRLSGPVPTGAVLARFFEHGSYHLTQGALRYRRGMAGRQPLTPEVLRTPPSRFEDVPGGIRVELAPLGPGGTRIAFFARAGTRAPPAR